MSNEGPTPKETAPQRSSWDNLIFIVTLVIGVLLGQKHAGVEYISARGIGSVNWVTALLLLGFVWMALMVVDKLLKALTSAVFVAVVAMAVLYFVTTNHGSITEGAAILHKLTSWITSMIAHDQK